MVVHAISIVLPDGKPKLTSFGRKATIREFYGMQISKICELEKMVNDLSLTFNCVRVSISLEVNEGDIQPIRKTIEKITQKIQILIRKEKMHVESCPFCHASLKRVNSEDLWVLPCRGDLVDQKTMSKEDKKWFYNYVNKLPKDVPDVVERFSCIFVILMRVILQLISGKYVHSQRAREYTLQPHLSLGTKALKYVVLT
uniref:Uncharacterized protein n=1 Tax=Lactuca sativa TaxID=4236 RepID=A0A9R1WMC0_LACSA|nr:hypothetical protein LSAT_V11C100048530 [Lactuca sativa]